MLIWAVNRRAMFFNAFISLALSIFLLSTAILPAQTVTIQSAVERPAGAPFFIRLEESGDWSGRVLENAESGAVLPVQVYDSAHLVALCEASMAAGESRTYRLRAGKKGEAFTQVEVVEPDGWLKIISGEKEALDYSVDEQLPADSLPAFYRRSGFIHPVRSPSGVAVTDGFPVGHTHQHGIFMAWVNTLFRDEKVDFWNQHRETGTVEHFSLDTLISGPVFAKAVVRLRHRALAFGPALEEEWVIRVFNNSGPLLWELDSRQVNITEDTLHLLEYHYGGLGIRGSKYWSPDDKAHFYDTARVLTGAGDTRPAANHTHPGWVALYGDTPSGMAGIAAMDHPGNFRFPQAVRVHPEMPYFCFAPVVDGAFVLAPGVPYFSRYRFVVFDGPPDEPALELFYRDFGAPVMGRLD